MNDQKLDVNSAKVKPIILVDGSSYLYRAFHAMPDLRNASGEPTGAVYGVFNMLKRLVNDYRPEHVAVIFDAKGKNFRHDLYKEYKAHRPAMPDDLRAQIEPLHRIVAAMGLPLLVIDGVEADDVIGTLAVAASAQKLPILISTGDKDMAQLVDGHVTLVNTMTNTVLDFVGVVEKFGVPPERIIDYLSLIGDTVDNVPGVEKCGPKTAVKWLQEYGTLENLMQNADKISGKVGENLRTALSYLPLSKQLVTIKTDVDLNLSWENLKVTPKNEAQLRDLFKVLEFKTWLSEVSGDTSVGASIPTETTKIATTKNYHTILTAAEFSAWLVKLQQAELFAFDTETTSLNYIDARLVGVSFSIQPNEAVYIPVGHDYMGAPTQLTADTVLSQLKPFLENPRAKIIGQHIKFDKNVLANYGITLQGIAFDTMLESYCLNSVASRHDMGSLATKYLGLDTISFEQVAGKGAKQLTFNQIPLETASEYAAEDADITLQLHQALWQQLSKEAGPKHIFETLEMPLVTVLSRIERTGVLVDRAKLDALSAEFSIQLERLQNEIFAIAGEAFNLESPKQLQDILYNKLKLPILKKTPGGQPSTAEPTLQALADDYPLPKIIMEYRSFSKLKSTYTDKLPLLINKTTGRIHTSYNQTIASTGRLSSSDPNLQNIPIRTEAGRKIRSTFIAAPGHQIISADYSQIELRIMAHLSNDTALLKAFAANLDIHRATAAEVFGVPLDAVTDDQRRHAKAINFGLIYGMSAFGLAKQLNCGRQDAQAYIDIYFQRYPGVKDYMESTREKARNQGYIETLRGRRLYLPDINARNHMERMAAERVAINAPMQGTAADIIKQAMLDVDDWLQQEKIAAKMIMQVHDELVLEVADSAVALVKEKLPEIMAKAAILKVPLIASVGVGLNWDEAAH